MLCDFFLLEMLRPFSAKIFSTIVMLTTLSKGKVQNFAMLFSFVFELNLQLFIICKQLSATTGQALSATTGQAHSKESSTSVLKKKCQQDHTPFLMVGHY